MDVPFSRIALARLFLHEKTARGGKAAILLFCVEQIHNYWLLVFSH